MITGRITEVHRTNYTVTFDSRETLATVRGNFHAEGDFPKVGDYVSLEILNDEQAVIEEVLPRKSVIKRKSADGDEEQIIASNVDLIIIVMGLDGDYNLSRLERYLLLAEQSMIPAIVVLNKVDVVEDPASYAKEVSDVVGSYPVYAISAETGLGLEDIVKHISSETTAVLLGSSGVGKSTIANWLLREEKQAVKGVRVDDSHGRHTTTSRQLFILPSGGYLIDTPGMRELALLESTEQDEKEVFEQVERFAEKCKFRNCDHELSDGCAVLEAVESGDLSDREFHNYQKLLKERAFLESKDSPASARHHKQNQKRLQQKYTAIKKQKLSRGLR